MDIYKDLARDILKLFFFNRNVYAKQVTNSDGVPVYNTIYSEIDANKLRYMLLNKESIMTYQQDFRKLKWLCLDFDIKSSFLDEDYKFDKDEVYRNKLIEDVNILIGYLSQQDISFLTEYSGKRGIHVWIFLDKDISKELGYDIINQIYNNVKFKYVKDPEGPIAVDIFPKTRNSRNNKIGLGVKIPLSYHLKSNRYSYCIDTLSKINSISEIDEDFLRKQKKILDNVKQNEVKALIEKLKIDDIEIEDKFECYSAVIKSNSKFEETINQLRKCLIYDKLFSKSISDLTEFDRMILVATLIRLESEDDIEYGRHLLLDYFSKDKDKFNEDITLGKLDMLSNLYPPNIKYIEKKYNIKCSYCENNKIDNAIQLIEGAKLTKVDKDLSRLNWIISSEKKYLALNDEVPLNFIYDELNNLNIDDILSEVNSIRLGKYRDTKYYKYIRKEEHKERILYSLSGIDRVLTTFIMMEISKTLYGMNSSYSYSYKINYDMAKNDIFINWNKLWFKYVKSIENKILSNSYDDYYVIKLDIHNYYDSIIIEQLREILYRKPDSVSQNIINNFKNEKQNEYKNMCEYLINACSHISNQGVPQGPAFARYLAEIYILQIDDYIESQLIDDYEFYFRYVDDMVILVESKEKAEELYKQICNHLAEIGLKINSKSFYGLVRDYKYEIVGSDIQKYFIDGIDETTPERVKSKAIDMVNRMLLDDNDKFNIKEIPFYLTHLVDERYIDAKKDKIIENIIPMELGRGSLFKHFYRNVLFKYYDSNKEYHKNLQGLSRGNFINELSRNLDKLEYRHVKSIIKYYLDSNQLYNYEYNEIYRLILLSGMDFNINLSNETEFESFMNIVTNTSNIKWNDKLLEEFLKGLQRYNNTSKVVKCLDSILKNSEEIKDTKLVINTIYAITKYRKEELTNIDIQCLYNLTVYMTLYIESKEMLIDIWSNLIDMCDKYNEKIKYNDWYRYNRVICNNEIKDQLIIHFLTCVFSETGMLENKGVTKVEKECAYYLVVYLFDEEKKRYKSKGYKDIKAILEEKNIKFLLWCLDENVKYFPSKEIAIQNTYLNNRIVLKLGNKIIVRGNANIFSDTIKDLGTSVKVDEEQWYKEEKYSCATIDLDDKLVDIRTKLKGLEYFEAIKFIVKVCTKSNIRGMIVNIFERGTFTESRDDIYLTFSKYDEYFVIDENYNEANNIETFSKWLIKILCESEVKNKIYNDRIYYIKDFKEEFIPKLIKAPKDQVKYIEILNEKIIKNTKEFCDDMYNLESSKIQTITEYLKYNKLTKYSIEINTLIYYNSLYNNEFDKFILYGVVDINEDSIYDILGTLNKSINLNLNEVHISSIIEYLKEEYKKIIQMANLANEEDLKKIKKLEIGRVLNDDSYIKVGRNKVKISECRIYELLTIDSVRQLNESDLFSIVNNKSTYFFNNLIIVIPDVVVKIFEIIENKFNIYDKSSYKINLEIKNCEWYDKAIANIMCQSEVDEYEARKRVGDFLKEVDVKYYEVILKVIGNYKCISNKEMSEFVENILEYTKVPTACLFPLKKEKDDNGTHQIIFRKYKDKFDRNTYERGRIINDYKMINEDKKIDNLVIISDISISGNQFTKVFDKILNNKKDKMKQDVKSSSLKLLLSKKPKITFINCVYTDKFKCKILEYMKKFNYEESEIIFKGTQIKYKDYLYINCIKEKKERDRFKEYIENYHKSFEFKMPSCEFNEYIKKIEEDDTKNILIARYKSMPKYHIAIFTNKESIFRYRLDK